MKVLRPTLLLLAFAGLACLLAAGCAGSLFGLNQQTPAVDLYVSPPASSGLPQQVLTDLTYPDFVSAGSFDIHLTAGSTVAGRILTATSAALAGAEVKIDLPEYGVETVVTASTGGSFSLPLAAGSYDVTVIPDKLRFPTIPPKLFPGGIQVVAGGGPVSTTFVMPPSISLKGMVSDSLGSPLTQWTVIATNPSTGDVSTGGTNGSSGYQIFVGSTGQWLVAAAPVAYSPLPSFTKAVVLTTDATFNFQFPSAFGSASSVSGRLTAAAPASTSTFPGYRVRFQASIAGGGDPTVSYSYDQSAITPSDGTFSLSCPAGSYTVTVLPPVTQPPQPFSHLTLQSPVVVNGATAIPDAALALLPKATIGGTVTGPAQPAGGASLHLLPTDGALQQWAGVTANDGTFSLSAVDIGSYSLSVVPSPESGLVRAPFSLTVPHDLTGLSYALPKGLKVSGRVLGPAGTPVDGATIYALDHTSPAIPEPLVGSDAATSSGGGNYAITVPLSGP